MPECCQRVGGFGRAVRGEGRGLLSMEVVGRLLVACSEAERKSCEESTGRMDLMATVDLERWIEAPHGNA